MISNGWLMAYHGGHNASFTCFNYKTKNLRVYEAEKLCGHKHLRIYEEHGCKRWLAMVTDVTNAMVADGTPLEFEHICTGLPDPSEHKHAFDLSPEDLASMGIQYNTCAPFPGHHWCHAYTNVMNTQHDQGIIWAFDAYGDDGPNQFYEFNRYDEQMVKHIDIYHKNWDGWNEEYFARYDEAGAKLRKRRVLGNNCGADYWRRGSYVLSKISRGTSFTDDLPGKIMGASAFGQAYTIDQKRQYQEEFFSAHDLCAYSDRREEYIQKQSVKGVVSGNNWLASLVPQQNDFSFQEECTRARWIQDSFENEVMIKLESLDMIRRIKEKNNTLLLSGGCALNVVMNQKLQDRYGIKIDTTPVPNDMGISTGMIMRYAFENGLISRDTRIDNTFAGPYVSDNNWWYNKEGITFSDELNGYKKHYEGAFEVGDVHRVASLLRQGNIIGMIQGRAECGARALGARSILCDASFPDMKDKINKVKRREAYRPFAPMCKVEDAEKYFESPYYDNLQYMNINVTVRKEYTEQLKAITHVDGTARLQAVDKKHTLVYNLLDAHGGVLLNTSFNVAGRPILTTYIDAFKILESSDMDYLVIYDHIQNEYVIFTAVLEHGY